MGYKFLNLKEQFLRINKTAAAMTIFFCACAVVFGLLVTSFLGFDYWMKVLVCGALASLTWAKLYPLSPEFKLFLGIVLVTILTGLGVGMYYVSFKASEYRDGTKYVLSQLKTAELSGQNLDCTVFNESDLIKGVFLYGYDFPQCAFEISANKEKLCTDESKSLINQLIEMNYYQPTFKNYWPLCDKEFSKVAKNLNSKYRFPDNGAAFITLEQLDGETVLVAPNSIDKISGMQIEDIPFWMLKITNKTDNYRLYFGNEDAYKKALHDFSSLPISQPRGQE